MILTTSPETHAALGIGAMELGMHVMTEKPMTLTVAQGRALIATAQRTNRKLAVAENYRWDPIIRLAKALIASGAIGPLIFRFNPPVVAVKLSPLPPGATYVPRVASLSIWESLRRSTGILLGTDCPSRRYERAD